MKAFFLKCLAVTRAIGAVLVLFFLLMGLHLTILLGGNRVSIGFRYRRRFIRTTMLLIRMHCKYIGSTVSQPALYVCNHRMMLDPLPLLRHCDAYIVSKAEVESYPLLGNGARNAGVIFVQRDNKSSRSAIKEKIGELLAQGKSVAIFPEGTVNRNDLTGEFSKGSFEQAAALGCPVVPVALDYLDRSLYWAENTSLLNHLMDVFSRRNLICTLEFCAPLQSDDALFLVQESRRQIDLSLDRMRTHWSSAGQASK